MIRLFTAILIAFVFNACASTTQIPSTTTTPATKSKAQTAPTQATPTQSDPTQAQESAVDDTLYPPSPDTFWEPEQK
ncbi:hypothetical protein BKH46_06330 [Helicobacter sp. 12S02634-8]|uniref:hypothetical protein n=1 Tax=Helicobacter sp. 12S02634-8 TaxID=1476199 RepID=UPI000BA7776F|nr:hypothetical protein [Helicobacter sp. 12S02634-8]PAF46827.1 hypothetical protein BKH46_06330 [Helicobacter sp. 12S02634-8]